MTTLTNLGFTHSPIHKGWKLDGGDYFIKVIEEGDKFLAQPCAIMDATTGGGYEEECWFCTFGTYRLSEEQLEEVVLWAQKGFQDEDISSDWGPEVNTQLKLQ